MTRIRSVKTNFTAGELSPALLGRGDLQIYENGAATLTNVLVQPTGGVTRRPGTAYLATISGPGRLVPFTFATDETYLLIFTDRQLQIFLADAEIARLATPWSLAALDRLGWAQSADVLLLVHPDHPPRRLLRTGATEFTLAAWDFAVTDGLLRVPFHRFADRSVTLTPGGTTGRIRLKASAPVFQPGHEGQALRVNRKQLRIAAVRAPDLVEADVLEDLPDTEPTDIWDEAGFSPVRGWPAGVCFHQDRLVIGGSRDLPNRLFLSRSGDLFNFDLGEGEDDAAIEFAILSDEVNPIRHVFAGRHLQVFTTGAEWAVVGEPLTPTAIRLDRQSRIGSPAGRQVPLQEVDGATLFLAADGSVREFAYTEIERAYQTADLAQTARHMVRGPVDMAFDRGRRLLLLALADGTAACLTLHRAEQVSAWVRLETAGRILSVAAVGGSLYWLVERGGRVLLEVWDAAFFVDSGLEGVASEPTARWSGLDHLDGHDLAVLVDGRVRDRLHAAAGRLVLDRPAAEIQAGLAFTHVVEPLPLNLLTGEGQGRRVRALAVGFRLQDTPVLGADLGRGPVEVPLRRTGGPALIDAPAEPFTGDRRLSALGWASSATKPLWRIAEARPLPFTLLSATIEMKVND